MHSKVTRKKFLHAGTSFLGFSALSPFGFGESLPVVGSHRNRSEHTEQLTTTDDETIRVLELRNYLLKTGMRDKFNSYFAEHFMTSQQALGGYVLGRFAITGEDDRFFWMRGFSDMLTRSKFLPAFYGASPAWKSFGPGANEMMLEVDNVHLVRPLAETRRSAFLASSRWVVIDYYTAHDHRLEDLISVFRSSYLPARVSQGVETSLWVSEMNTNDFPRLPAIQDPNLLVVITGYRDEASYQNENTKTDTARDDLKEVLNNRRTLVLRRT